MAKVHKNVQLFVAATPTIYKPIWVQQSLHNVGGDTLTTGHGRARPSSTRGKALCSVLLHTVYYR